MTGTSVDHLMIQVLGVVAAIVLLIVLRRAPRLSVALWLTVLCLVPIWIGIGVGFNGNLFLPAVSAVGVVVIAALLPVPGYRLVPADAFLLILLIIGAMGIFGGNSSIAFATLVTMVSYFAIGYVVGRVASLRVSAAWLSGAIAIAFTVVGALAVIEFVTRFNPFVLLHTSNGLYSVWGTIQIRGGVPRAEAAFGHSIALGCSLALAIPFAIAAPFRLWLKVAMVSIMLAGCVVSFSRTAMLCAAIALVLSVFFARDISAKARAITLSVLIAASVAAAPLVLSVFDDAGSEATGSADYRGNLLSLLGSMNPVGVADSAQKDSSGTLHFAHFVSIDSQLLLTGLTNGFLAMLLACVALAGALWTVLRGRAVPGTIAIVAQIPALATVALITQYSILLFAVAGIAASGQWISRQRRIDAERETSLSTAPTGRLHPIPLKEPS
ncbi:hypothetical protein [Leifsonia sp. 71-9]|uniref:hypothetical protein n=1 Tax=Leifsonia sp. 71-9 TaxID=1895934 RepID=UPI000929467D|nr:hypothetical protein [Leifsonia sp. 71-9]OJX73157.1 MAG: hypothetical protein BGO91_15640 [Leifsonia sp. 71-9]